MKCPKCGSKTTPGMFITGGREFYSTAYKCAPCVMVWTEEDA